MGSPRNFALADRYTMVLAAAGCLGVWREQALAGTDTFLADPAWPSAVLHRLGRRLGLSLPDSVAACEQRVLAEALDRLHDHRSYDLYGSALARATPGKAGHAPTPPGTLSHRTGQVPE